MTLTIIIPSYNTKDLLDQTLKSIKVIPGWQIVVVDNASTDGSVTLVKRKYPQVKLVQNKKNLGFAKANNICLTKFSSTYYLLLNSDVQLHKESIQPLITYLDTHHQVGMITPKVVLPNNTIDWACHRGMPTPWNAFTYFSRLETLFPHSKIFSGYHQKYQNMDAIHTIEATSATCLVVRKKAIEQVGLLDEQFFFYAEDLDWCLRFTQSKWDIVYYPLSTVIHYKSQSGKNNQHNKSLRHQSKIAFYDTMEQFYRKHYMTTYPMTITKSVLFGIKLKKWWALKW